MSGAEQITTVWTARGTVVPASLFDAGDARDTLTEGRPRPAVELVGALRVIVQEGAEFELGPVLGAGGMGIVFSARQPALARDVAVKMPRPDLPAGAASEVGTRLVGEALTAGTLEHPNIVPIHALGRDPDGHPAIVMKRVDGTSWREALDADRGADGRLPRALAARHFETLLQVASALHFAHARDVIHRDLKPENVMLGGFGEVYVVDWGLAVSAGPRGPRHIPTAAATQGVIGTPAYMAPEMAEGAGERMSARTDVYLLGAILHELVTGTPPHDAPNALDAIVSAFAARPQVYPEDVPSALVAICRRAMAAEPSERYADAGEFRAALAHAIRTEGSVSIAATAERSLETLLVLLERPELDATERAQVRSLFGAARFGFEQALRSWPENHDARVGLQATLVALIEHELAHEEPASAELLIADLPVPRPDLQAAARALRDRVQSERDHLRRVAHEHDLGVGARARWAALVYVSIGWVAASLGCHALAQSGVPINTHLGLAAVMGGMIVVAVIVMWRYRRRFLRNTIERRLAATWFLGFATYILELLAGYAFDFPYRATAVLVFISAAGIWSLIGNFTERAFFYMVPANLALAAFIAWRVDLLYVGYAGLIPLGALLLAIFGGRTGRQLRALIPPRDP